MALAALAIFIAVAVALFGDVQFPGWFWRLALVGTLLAIFFSHWLAQQTTFVTGALCPYCMIAWFGNFLILSSLIQEKVRIQSRPLEDESKALAIARVNSFVPIFHIVWLSLVIGAAYFYVS